MIFCTSFNIFEFKREASVVKSETTFHKRRKPNQSTIKLMNACLIFGRLNFVWLNNEIKWLLFYERRIKVIQQAVQTNAILFSI
jgi:hypothetical protein